MQLVLQYRECCGVWWHHLKITSQLILGCINDVLIAQTLSNTCIDHVLGRMSEISGCLVSFETVHITHLDDEEEDTSDICRNN